MKETDIIERPFLQQLRDAANGMASGNLNPDWVRAYHSLADAADRLDAMQARCTIPETRWGDGSPTPLEIGKECGWAEPVCADGCSKPMD